MGRRAKGRALDGWLVVDKPEGVTSTQVVGRARWAFEARKAGHAGTLDPLATGLLAIAFGEATKTVPFAQEGRKTYRFTVRWGAATSTDDREGAVTAESGDRPDRARIEAALPAFRGVIAQRPPAFSAIKVAGARAYDLARAGEAPDLAPRPIEIHRLELAEIIAPDLAAFEMVCGKGGYVRSVARDLGQALGCLGHVEDLRRLASGGFTLDGASGYDELEGLREDPARDGRLLPVAAGLATLPAVDVDAPAAARLRRGQLAPLAAPAAGLFWARCGDAPVAVMERGPDGALSFRRVFTAPPG